MIALHTSSLHRQAKQLLANAEPHPKKLVLIHTAVALGSTLLMTVVNYLFNLQIADTGGLGGLGIRSLLTTVQSVLELGVVMALPFWQIGLLYAALRWARGENAGVTDLLQGFRRFGTVFAFRFFYGSLFAVLAFSLLCFSTNIFMLTPWAAPLQEMFASIADATTPEQLETLLTPELISQATGSMTPLFILFGVLFLAVAVPLFYRLRFSEYAVMEGSGAAKAMVHSLKITRKNTLQLVKLDLHFWWFYLLQLLTLAVSYADAIASMLGISLPVSADVGFFLFYVLGMLLQGLLLWQYQGTLSATYCLAYDAFQQTASENPPQPSAVPWNV